jgi:hypothetical protein
MNDDYRVPLSAETGTAFRGTPSNNIIFFAKDSTEMIRIAPDGFYVRGVKLEQDETEARQLFDALMGFLSGRGE